MPGYFIGIDVGTTATKAVVVDTDGRTIRRVRSPHLSTLPVKPGRVDPTSWWASVRDACTALHLGELPVEGIGLSVHSPVVVPMDSLGRHVSAGYRFEAPEMADILGAMTPDLTQANIRSMGNRVSPATFMAAAMRLLQAQEPAAAAETEILGSVGTFIGQRLTGKVAIDPSQASYFGLFNTTGDWKWMESLGTRLGFPTQILPPVRPSLSVLGFLTATAAAELHLPQGTPVTVGGGDTACAAIAVGLDRSRDRLFTLGTTHVITDHGTVPSAENLHVQRAFLREGQWLRHGAINGGLALAAGARILGYGTGPQSVHTMLKAAASVPAESIASAPFFIPHIRAERGPFWIQSPVCCLTDLNADTDPAAAAWAVAEGVLFADRLVRDSFGPSDDKGLLLAGDLGAEHVFCQLAADAFGMEIRLSDEPHLPAVGAAMLAAEVLSTPLGPVLGITEKISPRATYARTVAERWPRFQEVRQAELIRAGIDPATSA